MGLDHSEKCLYLIDGSSYIYRAFYALPHLSTTSGLPTNAIYGFTNMLLKVIKEYKPKYMAVVFDAKGPTFREDLYKEYKAQRPAMPVELRPQIPYIKEIVAAFRIPVIEKEGFEADDIIGTIVNDMKGEGVEVVIVTGDKDMLQLVNEHVTILDTMRDRRYGVKEVMERYGVEPEKVVEVMGLAGDSIDNIPGVPGIGEKTAVRLIREFGTIERVIENIDTLPNKRVRESLKKYKDQALLSRKLASIHSDVPLQYSLNGFLLKEPDYDRLRTIFRELEFNRLLKELIPSTPEKVSYRRIEEGKEVSEVVKRIKERGEVSISIDLSEEGAGRGRVKGVGLSSKEGEAFYIHLYGDTIDPLRDLLEDGRVKKYGYDLKKIWVALKKEGISFSGIYVDTMLAAYLLNPLKAPFAFEDLTEEYLQRRPLPPSQGKEVHTCNVAEMNYIISSLLLDRIKEESLTDLYFKIDLPLIEVLGDMELRGIKVDRDLLHSLSKELEGEIERLKERIYALGGGRFNINSPKQLQRILFEHLKLKPVKKTKTGYSTDEEVLRALSAEHELPADILSYRHLSKLKSTYVDALLALIDQETGRIHTSFNQAVTATGRLSSSEPNLQNIPIRSELGKRIREVFVAEEGWILISADYSQIELRIVAHLSQDHFLLEAFKNDEDIHKRTASEIFGVPPEEVTEDMRRQAKAINFGIIYGISPYGLSQSLGISQMEAKEYIDSYFSIHKGVKGFIERTLKEADEKGYVINIFGRRRPVPELKSRNPNIRALGERIAINTPVQGSAADIVKKAMIALHRALKEKGLKARLILQIHDELLIESPLKEKEVVKGLVKECMEGAVELSLPLKVDIGEGRNWREAH